MRRESKFKHFLPFIKSMFHEIRLRLTLASGIVDKAASVKTDISQFCNYFIVDLLIFTRQCQLEIDFTIIL
jgi:hypothetical protein